MQPNTIYVNLPLDFWANVKLLSEQIKYSYKDSLKRYTLEKIVQCFRKLNLNTQRLLGPHGEPSPFADTIINYMNFRAAILEQTAKPNLMDLEDARSEFQRLHNMLNPKCKLPMNKRKGAQRHPNFFTCMVNILTEQALGGVNFDDDPRGLIMIERNGIPLRTFTRRMDGIYPNKRNPVAIWEVKEYYHTTSFGSRVADGIYETMLDGMELAELRTSHRIYIKHYLLVDGYRTWWKDGKSYLCRIVDMLHMGLIDEVLFGREIFTRWPQIVTTWIGPPF